jgi:hypothetical protein
VADSEDQRRSWTLFEEPYWLDAVAPDQWHAVEVEHDGHVIGRLPYATKRRFGLKAITSPSLTPWLGPWIRRTGAKPANELAHQHEVLEQLIKGLPKADKMSISCAPEFQNLMAFYWAGYVLKLAYTYRLYDVEDHQRLWSGMRDTVRNKCKKAEKLTAINRERDVGTVIAAMEQTFRRQGMDMSATFPTLERIDEVMGRRNQRAIYAAEDGQGRVHAAVYVVYDDRHSFYLCSGSDPELRNSGAHALALWHAIKDTAGRSQMFDFEGSMVRNIEPFIRGFGPHQVPRYTAARSMAAIRMLEAVGLA